MVAATQDVLFALAVGTLASSAMLWQQGRASLATLAHWRWGVLCGPALACGLYLWLQAAIMSGAPPGDAGPAVVTVLTQSHFGIAWVVGFSGVVIAGLAGTRASRPAWLIATAGVIVYASGKAAATHAADAGDFTLREAVQVIDLCPTALWAGSVIVAVCELHCRDDSSSALSARRVAFCTQLLHLATVALAVVIVTGLYNATQNMAHLGAPLLSVLYRQMLALKLAFVTLAVMLGGYNRMIYLPRLESAMTGDGAVLLHAQRGFDRLLAVEALAMVAVLMVAAVLAHTSPLRTLSG
ncbi:CopD family protein [Caballeronia telluris]|uniref:Copper-resistance membrane protein n=1 Tax=Caballeronia telluris TaxID=326475 RepID=A0A158KHV7_9BURK|nr:CopD family protein [Caballeronia telluris]SAL80001.1 copper-resistance membrane protein [Caballeronia telluris]